MRIKNFNDGMKSFNIEQFLAAFLFVILFLENDSRFGSIYFKGFSIILGLIVSLLLLKGKKVDKHRLQVYSVFVSTAVLNLIFTGTMGVLSFLMIFVSYYAVARALYFLEDDLLVWKIASLFVIIYVIVNRFINLRRGEWYNLFADLSRNYVSVFIILSLFVYASVIRKSRVPKKVTLPFFLGAFVASVWAIGRGGIIATGLMLAIYILYIIFAKYEVKLWKKCLITLLIIAIAVYVFQNLDYIMKNYFSRFVGIGRERTSIDSGTTRLYYINIYWKSLRVVKNFLFGTNIYMMDIGRGFFSNLHNSYLTLHAHYGIFGCMLIIGIVIKAIFRLVRKKEIIFVAIIIGFFLRAAWDLMFPYFIGDIVIFYMFFIATEGKGKHNRWTTITKKL